MIGLLLLTLTGCWKPYDTLVELDFAEVPYEIDALQATDAIITGFESDLVCPDGSPARIFAVYRTGLTEAAPIAIVFHSGAFDYVLDPDADHPLYGEHYYLESRLERGWSVSKVWETTGMLYPREVDAGEVNLGTLGAALADAGFVQIYPGNCWGDLWQNEEGVYDNDAEEEGFVRHGRDIAWQSVRILVEANYASGIGFELPVSLDKSEMYLIGLGDGGRAVTGLLGRSEMPTPAGVLLDSVPDTLSAYTDNPAVYGDEITGLARIFGENDLATIDDWSLAALDPDDLPENTAYLWSDIDPRLPAGAGAPGAAALEAAGIGWAYNTGANAHVHSNSDLELSNAVIEYLRSGVAPDL